MTTTAAMMIWGCDGGDGDGGNKEDDDSDDDSHDDGKYGYDDGNCFLSGWCPYTLA